MGSHVCCRTMESSLPSRDKRKSQKQLSDKVSEPGSWIGDGRKALTQRAGELFRNMGQDLDAIAKEYSSLLEGFLSQLPVQQHVDLKFLLFRLDFTEFYSRSSPSL
jgi:gamma-tubulin complex component 3